MNGVDPGSSEWGRLVWPEPATPNNGVSSRDEPLLDNGVGQIAFLVPNSRLGKNFSRARRRRVFGHLSRKWPRGSGELAYDRRRRSWIGEKTTTYSDGSPSSVHTTDFAYDGNQIALQFDKDGTGNVAATDLSHRYVSGPAVDQIVADERVTLQNGALATDEVLWPLADAQGTVRDVAKLTGTTAGVVDHIIYNSFGGVVSESDPSQGVFFKSTGCPTDSATNIEFHYERPKIAGSVDWLKVDPSGETSGTTNLYGYCQESPTNATDPSGLREVDLQIVTDDELAKMGVPKDTIDWFLHPAVGQNYQLVSREKLYQTLGLSGKVQVSTTDVNAGGPTYHVFKLVDASGKTWFGVPTRLKTAGGKWVLAGWQFYDNWKELQQDVELDAFMRFMGFTVQQFAELGIAWAATDFLPADEAALNGPKAPPPAPRAQPRPQVRPPAPIAAPGAMKVESFRLLNGQTGRDFVIYSEGGVERFSARLFDGQKTLTIGWTDNVARTGLRLREVQQLAGGPGSFTRITGMASDQLEAAIRAGSFDANKAAQVLSRSLGGKWAVQIIPRPGQPGVFDIVAELTGG
jgi:RHS repeat-associated protein